MDIFFNLRTFNTENDGTKEKLALIISFQILAVWHSQWQYYTCQIIS